MLIKSTHIWRKTSAVIQASYGHQTTVQWRKDWIYVKSAKDVAFWHRSVGGLVCLCAGLGENGWMDFNKTWWENEEWAKKELVCFWCGSKKEFFITLENIAKLWLFWPLLLISQWIMHECWGENSNICTWWLSMRKAWFMLFNGTHDPYVLIQVQQTKQRSLSHNICLSHPHFHQAMGRSLPALTVAPTGLHLKENISSSW